MLQSTIARRELSKPSDQLSRFGNNAHNRGTDRSFADLIEGDSRVKYRKQTACLGVVLAALAACGGKSPQADRATQLKSIQALERQLASIAGQANGAAPAEVDSDTRLDGAKAGPGLKLTTMYTLLNAESQGVDSTTFAAKLTPNIKAASCSNPELRPLINQGVLVILEYRGNDGKPIATVNINRDTCTAAK
jgi:hypothetical protein